MPYKAKQSILSYTKERLYYLSAGITSFKNSIGAGSTHLDEHYYALSNLLSILESVKKNFERSIPEDNYGIIDLTNQNAIDINYRVNGFLHFITAVSNAVFISMMENIDIARTNFPINIDLNCLDKVKKEIALRSSRIFSGLEGFRFPCIVSLNQSFSSIFLGDQLLHSLKSFTRKAAGKLKLSLSYLTIPSSSFSQIRNIIPLSHELFHVILRYMDICNIDYSNSKIEDWSDFQKYNDKLYSQEACNLANCVADIHEAANLSARKRFYKNYKGKSDILNDSLRLQIEEFMCDAAAVVLMGPSYVYSFISSIQELFDVSLSRCLPPKESLLNELVINSYTHPIIPIRLQFLRDILLELKLDFFEQDIWNSEQMQKIHEETGLESMFSKEYKYLYLSFWNKDTKKFLRDFLEYLIKITRLTGEGNKKECLQDHYLRKNDEIIKEITKRKSGSFYNYTPSEILNAKWYYLSKNDYKKWKNHDLRWREAIKQSLGTNFEVQD